MTHRTRRRLPDPTPVGWWGVVALLAGAALVGACLAWVGAGR